MDQQIHIRLLSTIRTFSISKHWVRFGIILVVVVLSTVISYWGSPTIMMLLLAPLVGLAGLSVLLQQPNLGFILIFFSGMFIPMVGPGGVNAVTALVAVMMALWGMDMFVVQRHFQFIRSRSMAAVLTFLVISTVSFFLGQVPWFIFARQAPLEAQIGGYAIFLFSLGGMLVAAHTIKDVRWLKAIVWAFLGLSAIFIISRTLGLSFIFQRYHYGFTLQSMFWTWLVALAASQVIYNPKLSRRMQGLLIALVVLTFYVAITQAFDWKSGWVPPLIVVAALLGIRYRNLIVFGIPLLLTGLVYAAIDLIATDEYSWGTRLDAWQIVLEIGRLSPFFGTGFANYYWYTPLFSIRGFHVSFNSHSQLIDLIAQTGYLGLIGFFWVLFELGRISWNMSKQLPEGFERAYAYGIFAGIVATVVAAFLGDWVLPFVYNVGMTGFRASILPWIFMGGLLSLERSLANSAENSVS